MSDVPTDVVGVYKYIIGGLTSAVTALAAACSYMFKQATDVNKARLKERDDLKDALNSANTVISNLTEASRQRNDIMQRIGEMMVQMSHAMTLLTERLDLQHGRTNKDLEVALDAVIKLAASVRELNTEVVELNASLAIGVAELKAEIKVGS